jgi:hypothetical protein
LTGSPYDWIDHKSITKQKVWDYLKEVQGKAIVTTGTKWEQNEALFY